MKLRSRNESMRVKPVCRFGRASLGSPSVSVPGDTRASLLERAAAVLVSTVLIVVGGFAASVAVRADDGQNLEYEVKGAFVLNFLKFIEWPSPRNVHRLCVVGTNPFGKSLETINERMTSEKPVNLAYFSKVASSLAEDLQSCDVIFLARDVHTEIDALRGKLSGAPVVTIAEDLAAADINLVIQEGKVRFRIRHDGLKSVGIRVSSKILRLAIQ